MSANLTIRLQNGETLELPMPTWVRVELYGNGAEKLGTYSSSELKSIEFPAFVAPAAQQPPALKEVEYDQTIRDSDGRQVGPRRSFRALAHDDPPEPAKKRPRTKGAA